MVAISSTIIHLQQHVLARKTLALSSQTRAHHHVQLLSVLSQIEHAVSRRSVSRGKTCILTSFYQVASSLENPRVKGEQTLKGKRFCETQGSVYFLVKRSEQLTYDLHSLVSVKTLERDLSGCRTGKQSYRAFEPPESGQKLKSLGVRVVLAVSEESVATGPRNRNKLSGKTNLIRYNIQLTLCPIFSHLSPYQQAKFWFQSKMKAKHPKPSCNQVTRPGRPSRGECGGNWGTTVVSTQCRCHKSQHLMTQNNIFP